jgi:hypothetical protein
VDKCEANRILLFVSTAFERAVPDNPTRKGYASQAVYGQLLLALIFDESTCEVRDRTLVASVQAVHSAFGEALGSLDERLARLLQARVFERRFVVSKDAKMGTSFARITSYHIISH